MRGRVAAAHELQLQRQWKVNARLGTKEVERYCDVNPGQRKILTAAMERLGFSGRALHRILKVARSIADLEGAAGLADAHLMEAIAYRAAGPVSPVA